MTCVIVQGIQEKSLTYIFYCLYIADFEFKLLVVPTKVLTFYYSHRDRKHKVDLQYEHASGLEDEPFSCMTCDSFCTDKHEA